VTSAQAIATGAALLFAVCGLLLASLGSFAGTRFAAVCTATLGGMALQRS
jgi:hypothetical protein